MADSPIDPPGLPVTLDLLSEKLFRIVSLILVFAVCLLLMGLAVQSYFYLSGLRSAVGVSRAGGDANAAQELVDHAAVITYARGLGAAFVKTSALFLGFILIFVGTLYVLRTTEANFQLRVRQGHFQGSLQTASPGLVIVTLGVALTIVALYVKSDLDYHGTRTIREPEDNGPSENKAAPPQWKSVPMNPANANVPAKEKSN